MSDIVTLDEDLGYLELESSAIQRGEIRGDAYIYRWDEIDTPACPFGTFEYDVQVDSGFGWFDANSFVRGKDLILNNEHRTVLILMARHSARIRVFVKKWTATDEQMDTIDGAALTRIFQSPLPGVRQKGLKIFSGFDRKRAE